MSGLLARNNPKSAQHDGKEGEERRNSSREGRIHSLSLSSPVVSPDEALLSALGEDEFAPILRLELHVGPHVPVLLSKFLSLSPSLHFFVCVAFSTLPPRPKK
jgi:hypothetical protein